MPQPDFKIVKRRLTEEEIAFLMNAIKETPTVTGFSENEWRNFDGVFVAEVDNRFVGVITLANTFGNWVNMPASYLLPEYRGLGIGNALYAAAVKAAMRKKKDICAIIDSEIAENILRQNRVQIYESFFELPFLVMLFNMAHVLNCYRIYEFIRKRIVFPAERKLTYGIKLYSQIITPK
jgi:GNAT superfamily N-acetyltransferase